MCIKMGAKAQTNFTDGGIAQLRFDDWDLLTLQGETGLNWHLDYTSPGGQQLFVSDQDPAGITWFLLWPAGSVGPEMRSQLLDLGRQGPCRLWVPGTGAVVDVS